MGGVRNIKMSKERSYDLLVMTKCWTQILFFKKKISFIITIQETCIADVKRRLIVLVTCSFCNVCHLMIQRKAVPWSFTYINICKEHSYACINLHMHIPNCANITSTYIFTIYISIPTHVFKCNTRELIALKVEDCVNSNLFQDLHQDKRNQSVEVRMFLLITAGYVVVNLYINLKHIRNWTFVLNQIIFQRLQPRIAHLYSQQSSSLWL